VTAVLSQLDSRALKLGSGFVTTMSGLKINNAYFTQLSYISIVFCLPT